ncbi:MAG: hypothetical protein KDD44_00585 [Bdellovibrionales bacterium]|nr:hypothetical protein [Bdellovibrionales bacterium]
MKFAPAGRLVAAVTAVLVIAILLVSHDVPTDPTISMADQTAPQHLSGSRATVSLPPVERSTPERLSLSSLEPSGFTQPGCNDPVGEFRAMVEQLRAYHDAPPENGAPSIQELLEETTVVASPPKPEHGDDDKDPFFEELVGSGFMPERQSSQVAAFLTIKNCASELRLDEPLKVEVAFTFDQEPRAILKELWLSFLGYYDPCDALIVDVVRSNLAATLGGAKPALPSGYLPYRIQLMVTSHCSGIEPPLLFDFLALADGLPDGAKKVSFYADLAKAFPWSPRIEAQFVADMSENSSRWQAIELLYFYARDLGEHTVRTLLLQDPALFDKLVVGQLGKTEAWATYKLLAQYGGAWGAQTMLQALDSLEQPAERAELIGFLADRAATSVRWDDFRQYLDDEDAVSRAAWSAIASRAAEDDDAFFWLQSEVLAGGSAERQLRALDALGTSGRDGVAKYLLEQVVPVAGDPEIRSAALANAAFQKDVDLSVLHRFADFTQEPDPGVRRVTAESIALAELGSGNIDGALRLAETMSEDPVLGVYAASISGLYLRYGVGDEGSLARWEQMKPPGFDILVWAAQPAIRDVLEPFAADTFAEQVERDRLMADLAQQSDHPMASRMAGQAELNRLLSTVAQNFLKAHPVEQP